MSLNEKNNQKTALHSKRSATIHLHQILLIVITHC